MKVNSQIKTTIEMVGIKEGNSFKIHDKSIGGHELRSLNIDSQIERLVLPDGIYKIIVIVEYESK